MPAQSHRRAMTWSALLTVGTASLVGVAVVGTPAVASTGGTATARAADVTVGSLFINASTNDDILFGPLVAALDGVGLVVGGVAQTAQATTPAEPTGADNEAVASLNVPGGGPVVNLSALAADTVRSADGLDATSSVATSAVALGAIDVLGTGVIQSASSITTAGAPSATASVADLSIGGNPFVAVPNVVINEAINLDASDVFSLIAAVSPVPLGGLDVTSGFGTINVSVQSITTTGADSAQAIGLEAFVNVDLHLSFVFEPVPFRRTDAAGWRRPTGQPFPVLELDVVGPLVNMTLAQSAVTRPAGDPTTTTTTTTTTVPPTTTTVPATTTTVPAVTTTTAVAGQLPQTGSTTTPVLVWATLILAAGASVTALATRRR